jgi:hypothetical protein
MAKGTEIYVAIESGVAEIKGQVYPFTKGVTRVRKGHPLLKDHGVFFQPVEEDVHYEVEQATAAPGEKRGEKKK